MKKIVYGGIKGVFLNNLEYNKLTNLLKENKNLYEQLKKEMEMQQWAVKNPYILINQCTVSN